ncbi:MAG: hypothetical protein NT092_09035 [Bacteroidia bacterium]|nr:hypothetical protein [Bacteroidia bacterium]
MNTFVHRLNPAVDKKFLILLAGIVWCCVGIMLISFAASWLVHYQGRGKVLFFVAGFIAAMPIHHFGFLKLVDKNLHRLVPLTEKRCLFSFITWKSYLIIVFMVTLGVLLRHSPIPKHYLSILYNGIGLGLFLSGIRYFRTSISLFHQTE